MVIHVDAVVVEVAEAELAAVEAVAVVVSGGVVVVVGGDGGGC